MGATSLSLAEPTWTVPRLDAYRAMECRTLMKATRAAR
ncbi:putative ubiquitin-conjugating enzyme E2 25 [Zea mays]|uniref:Putative ubiquitin-conjugating enzyme E2 25 n=1 Tax=Zea mays TaxID=4577 RepID=A0A1D6FJT9_MAIZE|nr:putative ubiquitin-conjugating enzyme E2 25 [Zea mays]